PVPLEERAVVAAGEKARLLRLGPARRREAGTLGLRARLLLRLGAQGEPDPVEQRRVELREHVALVLRRVRSAREQPAAVALDDARVVAGRQPRGADSPCEGEQLREPE